MPAPTDFLAVDQTPQSASLDTLEVAVRPSGVGTPAYVRVPILGEVKVTPAGNIQTYDAYADDADGAWQYAVKVGGSFTLTFRTAANERNAVVNSLIQASLKTGTGAHILFKVTRSSGAVYSGEAVIQQADPMSGARSIAETSFTATGNGELVYDAPTP